MQDIHMAVILMNSTIEVSNFDNPDINACLNDFTFVRAIPKIRKVMSFEYDFTPTVEDKEGIIFFNSANESTWEEEIINTIAIWGKSIRNSEEEIGFHSNSLVGDVSTTERIGNQ